LSLIAHSLEFNFLLLFQIAANVRVFALLVPARVKFVVLLFVQAVDLVIQIVLQVMAGVDEFRLARGQRARRRNQEGPDYE
jgi:hypothetical protein